LGGIRHRSKLHADGYRRISGRIEPDLDGAADPCPSATSVRPATSRLASTKALRELAANALDIKTF
jgi:hypothetical protein